MFVGAYWSARQATQDDAVAGILQFLSSIARESPRLANWSTLKKNRKSPISPIECTAEGIRRHAKPESDSQLGFVFGASNGDDVNLTARIGIHAPPLVNAVVLSFSGNPALPLATWKNLLQAAIQAFDPHHATVSTSQSLLANPVHPWDMGWLTYERGGEIVERPEFAPGEKG